MSAPSKHDHRNEVSTHDNSIKLFVFLIRIIIHLHRSRSRATVHLAAGRFDHADMLHGELVFCMGDAAASC